MVLPPAEKAFNDAACTLRAMGYPDGALRAMLDGVNDAFSRLTPEQAVALRALHAKQGGGARRG